MRKIRIQVVSILLLISLLLTGCNGWKNYIHTESSLMWEAADALEEKYDEEFVIHDVWTMSQTMFYATCSPEDELEIVFEAQVYKDGRGVYKDEYIQGAVEKQLEEKLQPRVEEVFGDCFVKVTFTWIGENHDYFEGVTVEDYYEIYGKENIYVRIFTNLGDKKYEEEKALQEFECFSQLLADEGIMEAGCRCYFLSAENMSMCQDYFDKYSHGSGDIFNEIGYFGFGYDEGVINKTFEEYVEIRKEINTNE